MPAGILRAAALLCCLRVAAGAELRVYYSAIERVVAQQVFTQDGRKYVKGTPEAKCSFAYLERPVLGGDNGRVLIQARFNGRSARNFLGLCLGLGDAFDVSITAAPYYKEGVIFLKDVAVDTHGRDGLYIRRARAALAEGLSREFHYPVRDEARKVFEQTRATGPYRQELIDFSVPAIQVTPDALILNLDFTLAVK